MLRPTTSNPAADHLESSDEPPRKRRLTTLKAPTNQEQGTKNPTRNPMFDPNLPQEGTPLDAVQMRSQFNGLKALIDAFGAINAAQVDSTKTQPPSMEALRQKVNEMILNGRR
jgi:hypothetical protein